MNTAVTLRARFGAQVRVLLAILVCLTYPSQAQWVAGFDYVPEYPDARLRPGGPGPEASVVRHNNPFVLYELGRNLVRRNFSRRDGAMSEPGRNDIPLYGSSAAEQRTFRFMGEHVGNCLGCHASPPGQPGFGTIIKSTGPRGRRSPHMFGAGEIEMIGEHIRTEIYRKCNLNPSVFVPKSVALRGCRLLVEASRGAPMIDFGDLKVDEFGIPQVNATLRIWFVNDRGDPVQAESLHEDQVAGFEFAVNVFGWGRGTLQLRSGGALPLGGEASTLREITILAARDHMGLRSSDRISYGTQKAFSDWTIGGFVGGRAQVSLAGAQQFDFGAAHDTAAQSDTLAGAGTRLSEGDLDAMEHFLLHAPPPLVRSDPIADAGRRAFAAAGCVACHTPHWSLPARGSDKLHRGDRRFFRLEIAGSRDAELGRLIRTMTLTPAGWEPNFGDVRVLNVFSDFRAWDIGPAFHEQRFDGTVQKEHRTAPLWGLGSQSFFGHAGQFATLEEVINAHGGAASESSRQFRTMNRGKKNALLAFLRSLQLYEVQDVRADIDGDGKLAQEFVSCGHTVGYESFDARFLFSCPLQWERGPMMYTSTGLQRPRMKVNNVEQAFHWSVR